jgi:DNA-binding beta-propeller fold protein YncE
MTLTGNLQRLDGDPFAVSDDGTRLVAFGFTGRIGIGSLADFMVRTVQPRNAPRSFTGTTFRLMLDGIALSPDGQVLYAAREITDGSAHFRIFAVDLRSGATVTSPPLGASPISGIALTPDGRRLVVTVPGLGLVKVFDAATLTELRSAAIGSTPVAYRDFVVGPAAQARGR